MTRYTIICDENLFFSEYFLPLIHKSHYGWQFRRFEYAFAPEVYVVMQLSIMFSICITLTECTRCTSFCHARWRLRDWGRCIRNGESIFKVVDSSKSKRCEHFCSWAAQLLWTQWAWVFLSWPVTAHDFCAHDFGEFSLHWTFDIQFSLPTWSQRTDKLNGFSEKALSSTLYSTPINIFRFCSALSFISIQNGDRQPFRSGKMDCINKTTISLLPVFDIERFASCHCSCSWKAEFTTVFVLCVEQIFSSLIYLFISFYCGTNAWRGHIPQPITSATLNALNWKMADGNIAIWLLN